MAVDFAEKINPVRGRPAKGTATTALGRSASNGVKELPDAPGVYLFKSKKNEVLYVGKAASLKKRVSQRLTANETSFRSEALIQNTDRLEWEVASSVAEALLREAALIKEYQPRYNVRLKDDKSYPYLLISGEDYPRIFLSRRRKKNSLKGRYIGPFTNAKLLREALRRVREIFPFRSCRTMPKSVCLDYHLGLCPAPCRGKISRSRYRALIRKITLFISGRKKELMTKLGAEMKRLSSRQKFEEAAALRNKMEALASLASRRAKLPGGGGLEEVRVILGKRKPPDRIEVYDISNIAGEKAVGSLVSFFRGEPQRSLYRRFRIKGVVGIDDYAMMKEIVRRRFTPLDRREAQGRKYTYLTGFTPGAKMKSLPFPDLIIIDGGKGHLNAALGELKKLGLSGVAVIALAKKRESLYLPGKKQPLILPAHSAGLRLLRRMRDEAHRFALAYHRWLRRKTVKVSGLDDIPGIGRIRKRRLLRQFGALAGVRRAGMRELLEIVDRRTARNIKKYLRD